MAVKLKMELDADQSLQTLDVLKGKLQDIGTAAGETAESFAGLNREFASPAPAKASNDIDTLGKESSDAKIAMDGLVYTSELLGKGLFGIGKAGVEVGAFALRHKKEIAILANQYYGWNAEQAALGAGLRSLIGTVTGLGVAVTAAYVVFKGGHAALKSTGERFVDIETGLKTTNKEFENFARSAKNYGYDVTEFVDHMGQSFEDFGVRSENNLDRIEKASGKFATEFKRNFDGVGTVFYTGLVLPVKDFAERQWKDFDERVTQGADNVVTVVGKMTEAWRDFRIHTDAAWTDRDSDRARRQADALDAAREATDKLTAANDKNRVSFEYLKALREENDAFPEMKRKAKEIEGPSTTSNLDFGKEQAEINRIKQRQKEEEGLAAMKGKFDQEEMDRSRKIWDILDQRQERLDAQKKASHDAGIKRLTEEFEKANEVRAKELHEVVEAQQKEIDERKRLREKAIKEEENERLEMIKRNLADAKAAIKEQARAEEEAARDRNARIKELSAQYGGGMRASDAVKSQRDVQANANRELFQLHQQMVQQYVTGDVQGFMESGRRQIEIKAQALQAMKDLEDKFRKDGGLVEQIKGGITDKDRLNQITDTRQRDALKDLVGKKENQKAFADLGRANRGAELTDEEQAGVNRLRKEAEKLEKRIKAQTRRDAQRGKIGEDEVAKAEGDLVKATVDAAAKSDKFGDEAVAGMKDAVGVQQQNAEKAVQNAKEIAQVREQLAEVSRMLEGEVNGGTKRAKGK